MLPHTLLFLFAEPHSTSIKREGWGLLPQHTLNPSGPPCKQGSPLSEMRKQGGKAACLRPEGRLMVEPAGQEPWVRGSGENPTLSTDSPPGAQVQGGPEEQRGRNSSQGCSPWSPPWESPQHTHCSALESACSARVPAAQSRT